MKQLREIRHRIFELRTDRNMTQGDFADFLGMSRQSIGFYESGKRIPDATTIRLICEKCNVSADWLLGLPGEKTNNKAEKIIGRMVGLGPGVVRWLYDETEKAFSIESQIERYSVPSISAFLNYLAETHPKSLKKLEETVLRARINDALDTPERTQELDGFLKSKGPDGTDFHSYLVANFGVEVVPVGEKRDMQIESATKQFNSLLSEYVKKRGIELRELIAQIKDQGGSEGNAVDTEKDN